MTDYKAMYLAMVDAAENAMVRLAQPPFPDSEIALRNEVTLILARGQLQAEEIYINTCEDEKIL